MAGTAWPALVAGAKAKASEVELKFDWLEGDLVPMSAGTKADATYDIGVLAFRWRDVLFTRQSLGGSGSIGSPTYSFTGESSAGLYRFGYNDVRLAVAGANIARFTHAQLICIDGTSTAPGLAFASSTGMGLARLAPDVLAIINKSTEVARVDADNRVGIGSTNPSSAKLVVSGGVSQSIATVGLSVLAAANAVNLGDDGTDGVIGPGNSDSKLHLLSKTAGVYSRSLTVNSGGEITKPLQPAFLAFNSTSDATVTSATIEFDDETYDVNSDYNDATYTFTAPVTGKYLFATSIYATDGGVTSYRFTLVTSNRSYVSKFNSVYFDNGNSSSFVVCADMDAADTAYITGARGDISGYVSIEGGAGTTWFSGYLMG